MKTLPSLLSLAVVVAGLASCASAPKLSAIDNALLAKVPATSQDAVAAARVERDAAENAHAVSQRNTLKAQERVGLARAALKTSRSKLEESKLAVEVATSTGTPADLVRATAAYEHSLARADEARVLVSVRKRELELARLKERLALEQHRMAVAQLELTKAEAIQEVDVVAAERIPVKDYRRQVAHHREEVDVARARTRKAEERLAEAQDSLAAAKSRSRALDPAS